MPLVKVTLNLSEEVINILDSLKSEYRVSTRSEVLERVVEELINPDKNSTH